MHNWQVCQSWLGGGVVAIGTRAAIKWKVVIVYVDEAVKSVGLN